MAEETRGKYRPKRGETPKERLAYWLAVWFGVGLLPFAPGTWGSLVALFMGFAILKFWGVAALVYGIVILFVIGTWAASLHQEIRNRHDQSEVVIDEVAGQWIALLPLGFFTVTQWEAVDLLLAFLLFRAFDIFKPWPIDIMDLRLKGGRGVMLDDAAAGLFAAASLAIIAIGIPGRPM